jgi:hypothetical protein
VRGLRKDRFGDPSARTHSARSLNDAPSVLNGH